jgi:hypothetical protein
MKEISLTFRVPETDFDLLQIEAALSWLRAKYEKSTGYDWTSQHDKAMMRSLYMLLLTLQHRYAEALEEPQWKMPPL